MRYKIGDRVRVKEWDDMQKEFGLDSNGGIECRSCFTRDMKKFCGKIFTVEEVYDTFYDLKGGERFCFSDDMLEPVSDKKIVITTDGKTTLARLYEDGKVTKTAKAICSPDDDFDFITGAKLAFDRLNSEDKPIGIKEAIKGAIYRVVGNSIPSHHFKIGEIVECIAFYKDSSPLYCSEETGMSQYVSNEDVELVKETKKPKFKVGDKIIGNEKANVYCITRKGWIGTVEGVYTSGIIEADGFDLDPDCFDLYVEPKYYNGKLVCVETSDSDYYTVGKIYECVDGVLDPNEGIENHVLRGYKSLEHINEEVGAKFIELKE